MSFSEWYEKNYKDDWITNCQNIYGFALETNLKYEEWCKQNNIQPVWG
ncbi:hypothetical protein ABFV99_13980 [Cytobacillus horneckiae]